MKRILSFFLIISILLFPLPSLAGSLTYHDGFHLGEEDAKEEGGISWGWLLGGFAGGSLLNLIGGGGVISLAYFNQAKLDSSTLKLLERRPTSYRLGYVEGYQTTISKKNMRHAAIGATIGIAINTSFLVILYLLQN